MTARQAIVVIHGMGEQRPVETLNRFSRVITPEGGTFYSKVDRVADSFEARRHLIPTQPGLGTQTEIYEYHWAHLMRGNQPGDLVPILRRILLPVPGWFGIPLCLVSAAAAIVLVLSLVGPLEGQVPLLLQILSGLVAVLGIGYALSFVPAGLAVLWLLIWFGIGWVAWAAVWGPLAGVLAEVDMADPLRAVLGGGLTAIVVSALIGRALPIWLTSSFVDVVRYLDTSPRSYRVRRKIRAGVVELLQGLHDYGRYDRIVVVAHSLGSYIAYDAISYLWAQMAKMHRGPMLPKGQAGGCSGGAPPNGLLELERAASALDGTPAGIAAYQKAQRDLWAGLREQGNPWLITDFISFGSPMYFAHQLYTRNARQFNERVTRGELVSCPPQNESKACNNVTGQKRFFTWNNGGRRVLHDAAPFAAVRWTNLWYQPVLGFFGDWFGGPLAPLFGPGIKDVKVTGNRPFRWIPGAAHAIYLGFPNDRRPGTFAALLGQALDINAASWLPDLGTTPRADPASRDADSMIQTEA
jgi:hypothetical protein